jgi:hypothetical protein
MHSLRLTAAALLLAGTAALAQKSTDRDWDSVQAIIGPIHGEFTSAPANLITPKYTSGALMGNGDIGVVAGSPDTTQQRFSFGKSDFWGTHWNVKHNAPEVSILSLGSLTISSPTKSQGEGYRVEQNILQAEVQTTLHIRNSVVHLRSWTADDDNVFLTEVTADGESVPLQLSLAMPEPDPAARTVFPAAAGTSHGMLWATRENNLTGENDYKARAAIAVRLLGANFSGEDTSPNSAVGTFTLPAGKSVWIVTVFDSSARIGLNGPSADALKTTVLAHAEGISPTRVAAMESAHREWWKQFWLRSFVDVHDSVLHNYYYGSLYVLGASSRPGKLPPSLWSNFVTTDNAAWGGRYFMNYNEEAPFYGVFSSNHAELAEPYNRMVLAQFPWQRNRTAEAGYQGVSFQRTFSPFTVIAEPPVAVPVAASKNWKKLPSDQKSNATFSLLPTIQYFEYTQDREFLRTSLYPAMKQLDAFWRDFAVRDASGQHWTFEHSSAHEGGDDLNPNLDIGFALRIEHELIETSKLLGVDANMRPVWQSFADQLAFYPTGTVNGKPVFYIAAAIKNSIKDQGLFEPGDQPINLEGTVYPGENLAIGGNPEQLQMARNSLAEMNSWGVTRGGNTNNGFCKIFPVAARIGWPADDLVTKFKAAILHQWRPSNLTVFQGGGGIETSGSIEALDSMLLQHEAGVMRIFPDWPVNMDASFTRLRAKGAFLVSSQQREGKAMFVYITAEKAGPLTLQSPWGVKTVKVDGRSFKPDASGQLKLNFEAGTVHHLVGK